MGAGWICWAAEALQPMKYIVLYGAPLWGSVARHGMAWNDDNRLLSSLVSGLQNLGRCSTIEAHTFKRCKVPTKFKFNQFFYFFILMTDTLGAKHYGNPWLLYYK